MQTPRFVKFPKVFPLDLQHHHLPSSSSSPSTKTKKHLHVGLALEHYHFFQLQIYLTLLKTVQICVSVNLHHISCLIDCTMKTHERSNGDFKTSFYFKTTRCQCARRFKIKCSPATRLKPPSPVTKFTWRIWLDKMTQQTCYATTKMSWRCFDPPSSHVSSIKQLVHELCLLQDFVHHLPGRSFLHTGFSFPFFWHCKKERNHKRPHTNASFRLEHILHWWNTLSAPPPNKHELQHVKTSCFGSVLMPFSLDRYFCDLKFCSLGANQRSMWSPWPTAPRAEHNFKQENTNSNNSWQIDMEP